MAKHDSKTNNRAGKAKESSQDKEKTAKPLKLPLMVLGLVGVAVIAIYGFNQLDGPDNAGAETADMDNADADNAVADNAVAEIPTLQDDDPRIPLEKGKSWEEIDDPSKDGWDTEVFNSKAMKQLKALGKLLVQPKKIDAKAVEKLAESGFASGPLRPDGVSTVFTDEHLEVERAPLSLTEQDFRSKPAQLSASQFQGHDGFTELLRITAKPFEDAVDVRFKPKVFRIFAAENEVITRQYFALSGRTKTGMLEQNWTWDIGWAPATTSHPPRMRWLRVVEYEQVSSEQPDGGLFVDCTESVLSGNPVYSEQFLHGMNHWFRRIQDRSPLELFGNPGLAVGDANGDGLDDLYVCQESGLPNRLFIQNPDGTATEKSVEWGVDWIQSSRSALFVDLDNDSDQDLVVAVYGGVVVAENDGEGSFRIQDVLETTTDTMSLSAVDYDLDGRLDIYVCGYSRSERTKGEESGLGGASSGFVVHDANNGGANSLFRNQIVTNNWKFTDVTAATGLDQNNNRWSLAAAWEDFDNDGDQDLYVANDYGRDNLYRNDVVGAENQSTPAGAARKFVDISDIANVEDSGTGMSITWGDHDRDGWMDALVSNMWSSAGNRITYQNQFLKESTPEHKRRVQRLARGNTLLKNQGDGTFKDLSAPTGIEMGRWAWGSNFFDINNDGWEDLIVSNGYITTEDTGDL